MYLTTLQRKAARQTKEYTAVILDLGDAGLLGSTIAQSKQAAQAFINRGPQAAMTIITPPIGNES